MTTPSGMAINQLTSSIVNSYGPSQKGWAEFQNTVFRAPLAHISRASLRTAASPSGSSTRTQTRISFSPLARWDASASLTRCAVDLGIFASLDVFLAAHFAFRTDRFDDLRVFSVKCVQG